MDTSNTVQESSGVSDRGESDRVKDLENRLHKEIVKRESAESSAAALSRQVDALESRVLELNSKLTNLQKLVVAPGKASDAEKHAASRSDDEAVNEPANLKAENEQLRNYVKRQNALIDVLKRQKVLLEAASAISIAAKDFEKDLELQRN